MDSNEIKEALKRMTLGALSCLFCKYKINEGDNRCGGVKGCNIAHQAIDRIDQLEKENSELFYKLIGVMWFVDKWLDGKELEQDEVNRASTMREKTLKMVEDLEHQVDKLSKPTKKTCGNCVYSKPTAFGRSKVYVECKHPVHVAVHCKKGKNSHKRPRTQTACKDYLSKEMNLSEDESIIDQMYEDIEQGIYKN